MQPDESTYVSYALYALITVAPLFYIVRVQGLSAVIAGKFLPILQQPDPEAYLYHTPKSVTHPTTYGHHPLYTDHPNNDAAVIYYFHYFS